MRTIQVGELRGNGKEALILYEVIDYSNSLWPGLGGNPSCNVGANTGAASQTGRGRSCAHVSGGGCLVHVAFGRVWV